MAKPDDAGKGLDWGDLTADQMRVRLVAEEAKAEAASKAKPKAPKPSEPPPADGDIERRVEALAAKAKARGPVADDGPDPWKPNRPMADPEPRRQRSKARKPPRAKPEPPPAPGPPPKPSEATTTREALEAFAFEAWTAAKRKGDPEVPTVEALAAWLPDAPPGVAPPGEAARYDVVAFPRWSQREPHGIVEDGTDWLFAAHRDLGGGVSAIGAAIPLGPVVAAWQSRPVRVPPSPGERILPLRDALVVKHRGDATDTIGQLLDPDSPNAPGVQLSLPGFERSEGGQRITAPYPVLVGMDGEPLVSRGAGGRGARPGFVLWLEVLLDLAAALRGGYRPPVMEWTFRDLARKLWPAKRGEDGKRKPWRWRKRYGKAIQAAAWEADRAAVMVPYKGLDGVTRPVPWLPVRVNTAHWRGDPDGSVVFTVTVPESSRIGGKVPRELLRDMGAVSAGAHRATFAAPYFWDRYGSEGGRLILPDRERRDSDNGLLDARGFLIRDGKGRPVKDVAAVPDGVTVGREPNPDRTRYPALTAAETMHLVHGPGAEAWWAWRDTRAALRTLEGEGYVILETPDGSPVEDWDRRQKTVRIRLLPGPMAARH